MKTTLKTIFILVFAFSAWMNTDAQVIIGLNEMPIKGGLLELKDRMAGPDSVTSTSGGLVLPRVRLFSETTLEPFIGLADPEWNSSNQGQTRANHIGLTVYNLTEDANFRQGIYFWNGNKWLPLEVASSYIYLPSFNLPWVTTGTNTVNLYQVYRDNFMPSATTRYFSSRQGNASPLAFPDYVSDPEAFYYVVTYYNPDVITISEISLFGVMTYTNAGKGAVPPEDAFINIVLVRK
jgi:hypothetical protein